MSKVLTFRISDDDYKFIKDNKINVKEIFNKALQTFKIEVKKEEAKKELNNKINEMNVLRWWNEFILLLNKTSNTNLILKKEFTSTEMNVINIMLRKYQINELPCILLGCFWNALNNNNNKLIVDIQYLLNNAELLYNTFKNNKDKILDYLKIFDFDIVKQVRKC